MRHQSDWMDHLPLRMLFVLISVFVLWATAKKPAFFWEHSKARRLRGLLGDVGATLVYVAVALWAAWLGLFGQPGR